MNGGLREAALKGVPAVLGALLEDDEEFAFDAKDMDSESAPADEWRQIGGDYGDPWEYGGSWYNDARQEIWYFAGLEAEESGEYDPLAPDNIRVPPGMQAALNRRFPLDYVDPDGDAAAGESQREANRREQERVIGNYQYARSAHLKLRQRRTFWSIDTSRGRLEPWMEGEVSFVANSLGMSEEEFLDMPLPTQLLEFAHHFGFHEVGEAFKMSQSEAREALGVPDL
jgi:hypothetical protein